MNKLFRRFVAYTIDMMVILLVTESLSGVPYINKQLDDYNKYYQEYLVIYNYYFSFKNDLNSKFKDEELSKEEYDSLVEEYDGYVDILSEYYVDGSLSQDNYVKLNDNIDKNFNDAYLQYYYKIDKNSICYFVVYLIVVLAYFILFNKYTDGQTLGKKLMRLKIVNSKDVQDKVPIWSYIVRALILYQPIYYIIKLVGINFMNVNMYYDVTSNVYYIHELLNLLILVMVMLKIDGRGLQDLLARTRVVLYDKNGCEVQDKFELLITKKINELKDRKKKIIDEESTKQQVLFLYFV